MAGKQKQKRIVALGYVIVANTGTGSSSLSPGGGPGEGYVVFNEDDPAHKAVEQEIEAGRLEGVLEIQEVDVEQERAQQVEADLHFDEVRQAEAIAQAEEVREAQIKAGEGIFDPSTQPVSEVMAYLRNADPEEAERVKRLEAATDRNSKQVADFEPKKSEE